MFHWSAGLKLGNVEVYACDSHENRDPIEMFVEISSVWEKHIGSLRCFKSFAREEIPENSLIWTKTGRAMMLGATMPTGPVCYAEGYRQLQGHPRKISLLSEILGDKFCYRNPRGILHL